MNSKWLELAGQLLELAADEYGLNYWQWPADWTPEERYQLALAMQRHNMRESLLTVEEIKEVRRLADDKLGPNVRLVMDFLGKELRKLGSTIEGFGKEIPP